MIIITITKTNLITIIIDHLKIAIPLTKVYSEI